MASITCPAVKSILEKSPRTSVIVVGPSKNEKRWRDAWKETKGRIHPIGVVPIEALDRYIALADVALESFPLGSPTALMEVARYGVPCIGLKTPVNSFDLFDEAGISCDTVPQLVDRVVSVLTHPPKDNKLLHLLKQRCFPVAFSQELKVLYEAFPDSHVRRIPLPRQEREITAFEIFIAENAFVQAKRWRQRAEDLIRTLVCFYALYFYRLGPSRRIYSLLNSYGMM